MGKFPVISITLKGVSAMDYEGAKAMLRTLMGNEALRFQFLLESPCLSSAEKLQYKQLTGVDVSNRQSFSMSDDILMDSLRSLCSLLYKHYHQKPILLIDEYDVPLDKANQCGYYDEMAALLQNLFGQALKTNDSLYFAVLTGCLRIAKESIFTGLNNLNVFSITNRQFSSHFGFSDSEVVEMLDYYGLTDKYDIVKKWYDGYRFGNVDVYCPWDVINYCKELRSEPEAPPRAFWINTSGNDIIREFIQRATLQTKREIESLVAGESVLHRVNQELTYRDLYQSNDNLWSVLFTTGYLTQRGQGQNSWGTSNVYRLYHLVIPNLEIRQIFIEQILEWFQDEVRRDAPRLNAFCTAFSHGDAKAVEESFNAYVRKTISIRDTSVRNAKKENFYHGILLGLLSHREDWLVSSNVESGDGFSDILVEMEEEETGIVVEVKYSDNRDLDKGCTEALAQIDRLGYETRLRQDGMEKVIKYGIACYKKQCRVVAAETKNNRY